MRASRHLPASVVLLAAVVTSALTGCTTSPNPAPTPRPSTSATLPLVAYGGVSGRLLGHISAAQKLEWLQVTDDRTAFDAVSTGRAAAALVVAPGTSWKQPAGGTALAAAATVYRATDAFYSRTWSTVDTIPAGATVVLPKETAPRAAALRLLASKGLVKLGAEPTVGALAANPKGLVFTTRAAYRLPAALAADDLVYLPADVAATSGVPKGARAVITEPPAARQVVSLVVRAADRSSPRIAGFRRALTSATASSWFGKTFAGVAVAAG